MVATRTDPAASAASRCAASRTADAEASPAGPAPTATTRRGPPPGTRNVAASPGRPPNPCRASRPARSAPMTRAASAAPGPGSGPLGPSKNGTASRSSWVLPAGADETSMITVFTPVAALAGICTRTGS